MGNKTNLTKIINISNTILLIEFIVLLALSTLFGFGVSQNFIIKISTVIIFLFVFSTYYNRIIVGRIGEKIVLCIISIVQVIMTLLVGLLLCYPFATLNYPLIDSSLDQLDKLIYFNWQWYFNFVTKNSAINLSLRYAYESFLLFIVIVPIALVINSKYENAFFYIISVSLSLFLVVIISGFLPALDAYHFYGVNHTLHPGIRISATTEHIEFLLSLRDGTVRDLGIRENGGIITFPSFHAAGGMLIILGLWSINSLRWPGVVQGTAIILSTPVYGSHYLVDALAGVVLACIVFFGVLSLSSRVWLYNYLQSRRKLVEGYQ